jgi:hypothetical protein
LNVLAQWSLFLPVSIFRSYACIAIISGVFGVIFPINNNILLSITWSVSPIIFLFTVSKTIPKGKHIVTNVLGGLWIIGSIFEVVIQSKNYIVRIVQILAVLVYLFFQNKTWRETKNKPEEQT